MVTSIFAGANNGQAACSDPELHFSIHIKGKRHKLSFLMQLQLSLHADNNPESLH